MSDSYQEHTVAEGEDLASIAVRYRVSVDEIWDDPKNQQTRSAKASAWRQELGSLQESPYVLQPGDLLYIPPYRPRKTEIVTDQRHVFRRVGLLEKLTLFLKNGDDPRKAVGYRLTVADGTYRQNQVFNAVTGGDGKLEHWVDSTSPTATLEITADPALPPEEQDEDTPAESYELLLRHLDPVTTDAGVRARLVNLGLLDSLTATDDEMKAAVRQFQRDCGIDASAGITPETREWLVRKYGS